MNMKMMREKRNARNDSLFSNQASEKFFSVPHAVPSLNNELLSRVVFARMKVRDDEKYFYC